MNTTALVGSGGFFRGAFQVGALDVMYNELGMDGHDLLVGTSVFALIAGYLAQFRKHEAGKATKDLLRIFGDIRPTDVIRRHFPFGMVHALWRSAIYDSSPLRDLIDEHFDPKAVLSAGRRLRVGAVNLNTGEGEVFTESHAADLAAAIYASAAAPFAVELGKIERRGNPSGALVQGIVSRAGERRTDVYSDWGVRDVTPLRTALGEGADRIDVLATWSPGVGPWENRKPNVIARTLREFDVVIDEIQRTDLTACRAWNAAIRAGSPEAGDKRLIDLHVVMPTALKIDAQHPTPEQIAHAIEHGRERARAVYGSG